jgi:hypothetical protein
MTTRSPRSTRRAPAVGAVAWLAILVAAGAVGDGCYKPVIDDGGFKCAPTGKKCPDGLSCGSDGRCWQMPLISSSDAGDGKVMSDAGDGGDADAMCALGVVAPLCQAAAAAGQSCNPACQTGCTCGRCNVVGKATACVAAGGTVKLGDPCKLGSGDNCAPGLVCRKEACGNGLARCYKHCTSTDQCPGSRCQLAIPDDTGAASGFLACDVTPQTCDPVGNTGCPDLALNCYLTGANDTLCDCPLNPAKPGKAGAACTFYNDCDGGFVCVGGVGGVAATRCRFACSLTASPSGCPSGVNCVPVGTSAKFGYCDG